MKLIKLIMKLIKPWRKTPVERCEDCIPTGVTARSGGTDGGEITISGCTDPFATNFNPSANSDDGSCEYGSEGAVNIVMETTSPLTIDTKIAANAVDMFFNGSGGSRNLRDITDADFITKTSDVQFQAFMYPSGGIITNYTNPPANGHNTDGYGMEVGDFSYPDIGDDIFTYGGGVASPLLPLWGESFATSFITFKNTVGITGDIAFNVRNNTIADLDWWVTNADPDFILLGDELQSNIPGIMDGDFYKSLVAPFVTHINSTYPNINIIIDSGLVYKTNSTTTNWNNVLRTIPGVDSGKFYIQVRDKCPGLTTNQASNLILLKDYLDKTLPGFLTTFKVIFPTLKMSVVQMNIEDNRAPQQPHLIDGMTVGCWTLARILMWILQNTEDVNYASWESYKNINVGNSNTTNNNYEIFKLINPLFQLTNVGTVTVGTDPLGPIRGLFVFTGGTRKLLLINSDGIDYQIPVTTVTVDGVPLAGTITRSSIYGGTSWSDTTLVQETGVVESTIIIRRRGTSLITF